MGHLHRSKDILQASNLPVKVPNLDLRKTGKSEGSEHMPTKAGSKARRIFGLWVFKSHKTAERTAACPTLPQQSPLTLRVFP